MIFVDDIFLKFSFLNFSGHAGPQGESGSPGKPTQNQFH